MPRDELLAVVATQQWLQQHMGQDLQLLGGIFVLVPSPDLQAAGASSDSVSGNNAASGAAMCAAVPWRLRQVLGVAAPAGADPATELEAVTQQHTQVRTAAAAGQHPHCCWVSALLKLLLSSASQATATGQSAGMHPLQSNA